jgi:hypothetical protein
VPPRRTLFRRRGRPAFAASFQAATVFTLPS